MSKNLPKILSVASQAAKTVLAAQAAKPASRIVSELPKRQTPLVQTSRAFSTSSIKQSPRPKTPSRNSFRRIMEYLHNAPKPQYFVPEAKELYSFTSDTGASRSPKVVADFLESNLRLFQNGGDPQILADEKDAIKTLFVKRKSAEEDAVLAKEKMTVFSTSSTTQANKVMITAIGNINPNNGEIALAVGGPVGASHVFLHEVGQPAEAVVPQDQVTGKLTVADLEKAIKHYESIHKKVKIIHLDQPTNGDHFYSPDEVRAITKWAHARNIPVSMDAERLAGYLAISGKSYYDFTVDCGVDVVSVGHQKNGGPPSSATIILDKTYLSDPKDVERRANVFIRVLGNMTDNPYITMAGWEAIVEDELYLENADKANKQVAKIADVVSQFSFDGKKVEIQNYPLTSNMLFVNLPRDFVAKFNSFTDREWKSHFKLGPDRRGITRIVASYDASDEDTQEFIKCIIGAYKEYCSDKEIATPSISTERSYHAELPNEERVITVADVEMLFDEELRKAKEVEESTDAINHKFTVDTVPVDSKVMIEIVRQNLIGYHKPYGEDKLTDRTKQILRKAFKVERAPITIASSKEQGVICAAAFLKPTDHAKVLVAESSYSQYSSFGMPVMGVDSSGEYKRTGKLDPASIAALCGTHNSMRGQHKDFIAGILVRQPTSLGFAYSQDELEKVIATAHKYNVPVIMDMRGCAYHLEREGKDYHEYSTDCGADLCVLGLSQLGGAQGTAVIVLNTKYLPYQTKDSGDLEVVLERTTKEHGGKVSGASLLAIGWEAMFTRDLRRENAAIVNKHMDKMLPEFKQYQFNGKPLEFENENPDHNIIAMKLPAEFVPLLNERGYNFTKGNDDYVRCAVHYHVTESEVEKLMQDFREAHKEYEKLQKPITKPAVESGTALSSSEIGLKR